MATDLPVTDGLVVDLDASKLDLGDGDPVEVWPDASAAGNDHSIAEADRRPTLQHNQFDSLPAVRFDGIDDTLRPHGDGQFTLQRPWTIFVVSKDISIESGSTGPTYGWNSSYTALFW